jgi:hypothetical protein
MGLKIGKRRSEAHDSWWRELLQRAGTAYVRPAYLATPSVRAWLREAAVRNDLKALARATHIAQPTGA